ncbi:MAG: hypothetical protein HOO06_09140 [Bdellovibrionaceae bacterium]|nr:hypothetical protein [Pseudobdellovibrionaceae bacterium]
MTPSEDAMHPPRACACQAVRSYLIKFGETQKAVLKPKEKKKKEREDELGTVEHHAR